MGDVIGGTVGNDVLQGTANSNLIWGGEGNDTLSCGGGNDWLIGGTGDDIYYVISAGDLIFESPIDIGIDLVFVSISYTLQLGQSIEYLGPVDAAMTTAINFIGNDLSQLIEGNAGPNTLDGSGGNDTLNGRGGNDTIFGGAGVDTTDGGLGDDIIYGGPGIDTLNGGDGDDVLVGNDDPFLSEADTLNGGNGDDAFPCELTDRRSRGGAGTPTFSSRSIPFLGPSTLALAASNGCRPASATTHISAATQFVRVDV